MHKKPSTQQQRWRIWMAQFALLCLLGLHSIGLLHKHASAAEQGACVACQVVDHQALDVPEPGTSLLCTLLVLVLLPQFGYRSFILCADYFRRPQSRAPPLFLPV